MANYGLLMFFLLSIFALSDLTNINYYEIDNLRIEYGGYQEDGYLSIFNYEQDEYISELLYDDGFVEDFIYLAEVKNNFFIIVCERSFYVGEEKHLNDYKLLKFNLSGELISSFILENKYQKFYNHHQILVAQSDAEETIYLNEEFEVLNELDHEERYLGEYKAQYQGEAFINDEFVSEINITYPGNYHIEIRDNHYLYHYSIVVEADVIFNGEMVDDIYYGDVSIYSFGELYLNDNLYSSGEMIKEPGDYLLEIHGANNYLKTIKFLLHPNIYYNNGKDNFILDEASYINYPIQLYIDVPEFYLNGELYNNEYLNQPGDYQLSYRFNHLEVNIEFDIYPRVDGIENNGIYKSINFYVFGDAFINSEKYQGMVSINQPGKYHLELYFNDEVYESIHFEIINENQDTNVTHYFKYGFIVLLGLGVCVFFWKK